MLRTILSASSYLQPERERPNMERKYMNSDKAQWKEPEFMTLISEVSGGKNIRSKQAHVLKYKSQSKTQAKPEEPESRSRHW